MPDETLFTMRRKGRLAAIETRRKVRIAEFNAKKTAASKLKAKAAQRRANMNQYQKAKAKRDRFAALSPEQKQTEQEARNARAYVAEAKRAAKRAAWLAKLAADAQAFKQYYGFDPRDPPAEAIGKYYPWPVRSSTT